MQVAINPTNPLQVAGFTHNGPGEMSVFRSDDGGFFWEQTVISSANDGLGNGSRFDPTLQFDADGHLFIAYGFDDGARTTLVTARSDDGGATFSLFRFPASEEDHTTFGAPGLDKWSLTTGLDPTTGGQAVYIAYTWITLNFLGLGLDAEITVVGSNDGGFSYTQPRKIDDDDGSGFAGAAVGPNGELYVVWHDYENDQLKFDRDLDGLWGQASNFGNDVVVRNLNESFNHKITPASPKRGFDNGPSIDVGRGPAYNGRIYVAFTDTYSGSGDDTDIYLVTSFDHGSTWHLTGSVFGAGNVEGSSGTDFMATVAVDQSSGSVNVGYYTTDGDQLGGADGIANDEVNFRLASSIDGGATWARANLSTFPSRASAITNRLEFGDYEGLAVFDGTVHAYWAQQVLDFTEAFTATASIRSASGLNRVFVSGTDNADVIEVMPATLNSEYVTVLVNGQEQYTGLWASLSQIVVFANGGDDVVLIQSPPASTPVFVSGGDGDDSIGVLLSASGGLFSNVQVSGDAGTDSVTLLNDQNSTGFTYTITDSAVSATDGVFSSGGLSYLSVESLTVRAGAGNDTFNILSTAPSVAVTVHAEAGNDTLVGPNLNNSWVISGSNQGTVGNVTFTGVENVTGNAGTDAFGFVSATGALTGLVDGGCGTNALDYSHYPTGVSVQLASSPAVGTATATGGVANIQAVYGSRFNDTLTGSAADDTFLTFGGRDVVRGNGGNDTIHVVGLQDPASILDGGSGSNLLWVDNVGANTWSLTGAGAGSVSSTGFANGNALAFTHMQRLLGGRYADTFRVLPGAGFSYLSGYGGTNWLDYSAYTAPVTVNLAADTATGVAGANAFLFQNVRGSRTARNTLTGDSDALGNVLVGGNAADTITAGKVRSILIGGRGADVITGGTADDIVIGGFTDFDQNQAVLEAVMAEWRSTADSYLTRIAKIRAGIASGGSSYSLIWGSGTGKTVHDDGSADKLRGDPSGSATKGLDWFFANQGPGTLDTILDLQTGEKVNNQP
jgi:hypothetical protein